MRTSLRITAGLSAAALATALAIGAGRGVTGPEGPPPAAAAEPTRAAEESPTARAALPARPNIVVVMTDDMRADDLQFAPYLRTLARREGLDFRNAFSPFPLCCPARASFLTGRYAHNHRVYWHEDPWGYGRFDDSRTLATALDAVGYQTGYVGKHLNRYGVARSRVGGGPSHRYVPRGWDDWIASLDGPHPAYPGSTYDFFLTSYNHDGRIETHREYSTRTITRYATDLVDRYHRRDAPFFLSVNYVAPHTGAHEAGDPAAVRRDDGTTQPFPTTARPDWVKGHWDDVVDRGSGMPRGDGPAEADISDKGPNLRRQPEPNATERRGLRTATRQRAESITVVDRSVRRLVERLKATGEWSRTVLFFTSDNGYFQGEHRIRTGKVLAHEPSLRVPLLAFGPGPLRDGRRVNDPATLVDLAATIVDLAGARPPRVRDGRSLLPAMVYGDRGWHLPVVTEAIRTSAGEARGFGDARSSIGLRTARYSFTRYSSGFEELYDLALDPLQLRNRARAASYSGVMEVFRREWWRYKDCRGAECRAPLPAGLRVSAERERTLTTRYWRAIDEAYGFRG